MTNGIIPALLAGKFDAVIVAGISITPARNLTVNFTCLCQFRRPSGGPPETGARLRDAGGFQQTRSGAGGAARRRWSPCQAADAQRPRYASSTKTRWPLQEVLNGKAHAFVTSTPTPAFEALKHPTLFLPIPEPFVQGAEGFALRKIPTP